MKKTFAIFLMTFAATATAQVSVGGYIKKDGTYVAPHMRSAPDGIVANNYSTRGNINPYTGQAGTVVDHQSAYDVQMQQQAQQQAQLQRQLEQQQLMQQQLQRQQLMQMQQLQQQQRSSGYAAPGCNPNYPATCIKGF